MQVKEYVQALNDEGHIRVEKIGNGNWYWSFLSEEKLARQHTLAQLMEERDKVLKGMEELKGKVEAAGKGRNEDSDRVEGGREELLRAYDDEKIELQKLRAELDGYKDGDPEEVVRKKAEIEALKLRVAKWTDNIYCLEHYIRKVTGGNMEAVEGVRRTCYGGEYIEGEGLKELSIW